MCVTTRPGGSPGTALGRAELIYEHRRQSVGVMPNAHNARGLHYEPHALMKYGEAHPERVVIGGATRIPDALLARATGTPIDPEAIKNLKKKHAGAVDVAIARGKTPVGIGHYFGMDGVSLDAAKWKINSEDLLETLQILECKVGTTDCKVLGSTIARYCKNLAIYGNNRVPPIVLLSPHRPNPAVVDTFAPIEGAFTYELIPESDEAPNTTTSTANEEEVVSITPYRDQVTTSRQAVTAWKTHRLCAAYQVMGTGKSIAGWLTLKNANHQVVRLFCAHTAVMSNQLRKEAKRLDIDAIDLTHLGSNDHVRADKGTGAVDTDSDEELSDDHERDIDFFKGHCSRIMKRLQDLAKHASKDNPVYGVICHATLRELAVRGFKKIGKPIALAIDESHKIANGKCVFEAILDPENHTRAMLMTATPPAKIYANVLGEDIANILRDIPCVSRVGLQYAIEWKRLVPLHVELVIAADSTSGASLDSKDVGTDKKVEAVAAWIVSNNIATTSIYVGKINVADVFATKLEAAITAIAGGKAWCRSVHSNKSAKDGKAYLEHFEADTFRTDGVMYKAIVSVGQLKEGFDMPKLQAAVVLNPPEDAGSLLQMAGRPMRNSPGKNVARLLVFGQDEAAAAIGKMLHAYDPGCKAITVAAVPDTYDKQVEASTPGPARNALDAQSKAFEASTREKLKNIVTAVCDNETLRTTQTDSFVRQCADKRPTQREGQRFTYTIDEVEGISVDAGIWISNVVRDWHNIGGMAVLSEANKAKLQKLGWFEPPPETKTVYTVAERVDQMHEFLREHKRRPTKLSADAVEASLASWLRTFKGKHVGSAASREQVGEDKIDAMLKAVEAVPTSKEFEERKKLLQNMTDLAQECKKLRDRAQPWPSGSEKHVHFLRDLRKGRNRHDITDDAFTIVRDILKDPSDAKARAYLEASMNLSITKHEDFKISRRKIKANWLANKRKEREAVEESSSDEDAPKRVRK